MILTSHSVAYVTLAVLSGGMGLGAAAVAYPLARRWRLVQEDPEARHHVENRVVLVTTLVALLLWLRIAMVPLWFWTLETFVPCIPGAMCLTGVHLARAPASHWASGLKLVVPAVYGYWLAMHAVDAALKTQPLMRLKLLALLPVGLLLVVEALADGAYLLPLHPRVVSCCTSVFDLPTSPMAQSLTQPTWVFVILLYALSGLAIAGLLIRRLPSWPLFVLAPGVVVAFFLALHTRLSPLLLGAPHHHCVFCIWQRVWDAWLFTGLVVGGAWLALMYAATVRLTRGQDGKVVARVAGKLALLAVISLALGLLVLALRILVTG